MKPECDLLDKVVLDLEFPDQVVQIGSDLPDEVRTDLITFLRAKHDCFAWKHDDMTGLSPYVIIHKLLVDLEHPQYPKSEESVHQNATNS